MDEKICVACDYFTLRIGFYGGPYGCCSYPRGYSPRVHELKECPRKWEPPEYIKRMSVERANLLEKSKNWKTSWTITKALLSTWPTPI